MARTTVYYCTRHNGPVDRDLLIAKKVLFVTMGAGGRTHRSRVVDWLCPDCVKKDAEWNLPAFKAPGSLPNKEFTDAD